MFGKRFELFRLFGFAVRIDTSWFFVVILVAWSLATGLFPEWFPDVSTQTYWLMGAAGALGLFASVVLHELAHSLVARRHGIEMKGITLFIFGGVAEMSDEPPSPRAEFLVAVAGPIASLLVGAACFGLDIVGRAAWPTSVLGVLRYLALINVVLVAFNAVPAFPLDGGRVLRSALWQWRNDLRWATQVSSRIGSGFGVVLIVLGLASVLMGNFIGGLWWLLIGLFLRGAAQMSYQQLLMRQFLEGEPVRRFMNDAPVAASRAMPVSDLVENYVYRYHHKMFPVLDDGRLVGCVTTREIKELPRGEWASTSVGAIAQACTDDNTVAPEEDAMRAFAKMSRGGNSRLMVVEEGRLVGILSLKDLLQFFSSKLELEELTT